MIKTILSDNKVYGTKSERLAMNLLDTDQIMLHFYETDSGSVFLWNGNSWIDVTIPADIVIQPFNGVLLSTTVAGAVTITSNLQDYNDWSFIISFADATNTILIEGSFDGTNFAPLNLLNVAANSVSAAAQNSIAAPTLFKIGLAAGVQAKPIPFKALRVTKGGAGTTSITVTAFGHWSA